MTEAPKKPLAYRARKTCCACTTVRSPRTWRAPGGFGLGQVPARLKPDATTTVVCGFCSTGCGLTSTSKTARRST